MRKSFIGSIVLHLLFVGAMIVVSYAKVEEPKPLPEVTKVKLIRPKQPPVQQIAAPDREFKVPETAPPLVQPEKKPKKPQPKEEK
ncbi:MAG: hypothetical protein H6508_09720, partial [Calditrichaeota bacterium]|nr:hypothetical protein [Calditrichota bacterium]